MMQPGPRKKSSAGFTLLEVVVAMAIVGLGVVTVMEVFSLGLRLTRTSSEKTQAVAVGRQVFDRILLRREPGDGLETGSLAEGYRWQLDTARFEMEGDLTLSTPWQLKEITLRILGGDREVEMTTLRLVRESR